MIALSTFSFSTAFGTKFRVVSIILIVVGFLAGGMYGSVERGEIAGIWTFPCIILYFIICISLFEWLWRHFLEDEECWFYTIFQKRQKL